jgi:hypothetical protein
MRVPVNPLPTGMRQRIPSVAVSFTVDVYETQPQDASAPPAGRLAPITARLSDDASQVPQRRMVVELADHPDWLRPGMWLQATVGIQTLQPVIYRMPVLIITDVAEPLSTLGGATLACEDPGAVLNTRPYETDTTLTGTLRSLVAANVARALTRTTDVSAVPAVNVPAGMVAEFGNGSWDVCLNAGDSLGYALMFNDACDVLAVDRNALPPAPVAVVERALTEGGTAHHVRAPTAARVLVSRGSDTVGLVGVASWTDVIAEPPPPWYLPYVIADRQEGEPTTTQAQADALARQLLTVRLSELDTYESMPILPAPWLEAGVDVVDFYGRHYHVRAVDIEFPSLATAVTLRAVAP